jgi:hypothetical protein
MRRRMEWLTFRAATLARLLTRLSERPLSAGNVRNWHTRRPPIRAVSTHTGLLAADHCDNLIAFAVARVQTQPPSQGRTNI